MKQRKIGLKSENNIQVFRMQGVLLGGVIIGCVIVHNRGRGIGIWKPKSWIVHMGEAIQVLIYIYHIIIYNRR
jgi:hypothetical protein